MLWLMSSAARAVPGLTLAGERWCKEGRPVAWHLAVKPANVGQFERDLQALEVASCVGCFTWYASGGTPAELEAADPARLLEHSKRLDAEHKNVSHALRALCKVNVSEVPDNPDFACSFIRAGADVNVAPPPSKQTPVHNAAAQGKAETVRVLIGARADVTKVSSSGRSPLHMAAAFGNAATVQLLVEARADLDSVEDSFKRTALVAASDSGKTEIARCLIEARSNLEVKDANEFSALDMAMKRGHAETAKLLIEAGADTASKDKWGKAPLEQRTPEALSIREEVAKFAEERKRRSSELAQSSEPAQGSQPSRRSITSRLPLTR